MDVMLTLAANQALSDGVAPDRQRTRGKFPYFGEPYTHDEQHGLSPAAQSYDKVTSRTKNYFLTTLYFDAKGSHQGAIMKLTGKKALITGGNSGIGLATARLFVAEAAEVSVSQAGTRRRWMKQSPKNWDPNARGYRADVTVADDRKRLFAGSRQALGFAMPHSPRMHAGKAWLLDSGRGQLVQIDPANGNRQDVAQVPGYARGLAIHRGLSPREGAILRRCSDDYSACQPRFEKATSDRSLAGY